ncbi:MAG: M6 family metalloprotease domain-containing protein [Muribaculaceae bacterium]|nr:M6 family metalloprotease domain-containing protein [Muribaculaceae bacterium]
MRNRLSQLLLLLAVVCTVTPLRAVPVPRGVHTAIQADGDTLHLLATGDEWVHALTTLDGLAVARDNRGNFCYASPGGGTAMVAHDPQHRTAAERAWIAAQGTGLAPAARASESAPRTRRQAPPARAPQVSPAGSPRIPILLVEFANKRMAHTAGEFRQLYATGNRSASQYFADQSAGQFTPQFEVFGIYTLPGTRAAYGANDSHGNDVGVGTMVTDAITAAGAAVDWSRYDNDGDGLVDVAIVVFAGVGEAQAQGFVPQSVWPCQWSLAEAGEYGEPGCAPVARNGVTINRFAVINEIHGYHDDDTTLDGIGTFCHEFSHCLGLPDFYPTVTGVPYYGMGSWSVMDDGCYNDGGNTPVAYSAYEKHFMGWLDPVEARAGTHYTLPPMGTVGDCALRLVSPIHPGECYYIENRRRQGWDTGLRAEGVLITHISFVANRWAKNTVNNGEVQLATFFAADNEWSQETEYADLYGTANHALTDGSAPAAKLFLEFSGVPSGKAGLMGKPITDILLHPDGTATLWVDRNAAPDADLNGDGAVDIDDLNIVINIMLRKNQKPTLEARADLDANGTVDIDDLNLLINIMLRKNQAPTTPFHDNPR